MCAAGPEFHSASVSCACHGACYPRRGAPSADGADNVGKGGTCAAKTSIAVSFIARQEPPRPTRHRRHQCADFAGVSASFGAEREWCCVFTQHMMYANIITLLRGLMFANMTVFLGDPFFFKSRLCISAVLSVLSAQRA